MVQVVNPKFDFAAAAKAANERLGKVIGHKYVVFEVTPGYTDSGYYGEVTHPDKWTHVFQAGDLNAVSDWQDSHVPDKGKYFVVKEYEHRERVVREWFPGRVVFNGRP